jgi:hypothetical protein
LKPPRDAGGWEERLKNNVCQKNWHFDAENYFLIHFCEKYKMNSQGVVASPSALVPINNTRALLILEEEKMKNSIFNEEKENTNESGNFSKAFDLDLRSYNKLTFKREKVIYDVLNFETHYLNLFRFEVRYTTNWKMFYRTPDYSWIFGSKIIAWGSPVGLIFDERNNLMERRFRYLNMEETSESFFEKLNQNQEFKPKKSYDTLISVNAELHVLQIDTVFEKNKAIQNFDRIIGDNLQNVEIIQNLTDIYQLNLNCFRGIKSMLKFKFYDFTKFPSLPKEEEIQFQNLISNTFNKHLDGLQMNDGISTLQIKIRINITSRKLRRIRRVLIKMKQGSNYEVNFKLTLWMALIIYNMNKFMDKEVVEEIHQAPKYKKIPKGKKKSKKLIKELIRKVGRSKSVERKPKEEKETLKLEKYKKAWMMSQGKMIDDWEPMEGLDWDNFRLEARANVKCIVPDEDTKMPKYAMNVFNLEGSLMNKSLTKRISFAMSKFVLEEYTRTKNPQGIINNLTLILKVKQRKEYAESRKLWAERGDEEPPQLYYYGKRHNERVQEILKVLQKAQKNEKHVRRQNELWIKLER